MLDVVLPPSCLVCRREGRALCAPCADALVPAPAVAPPVGVERCVAVVSYVDAGRELVAALKYRNRRDAVGLLGRALAVAAGPDVDVVTWVPTTSSRRRARGYDQAAVLARAVGRALGRPCRRTLRRRAGPPQTGNDRQARLIGPRFTVVAGAARLDGRRVLLVDDVVTTGATFAAAAGALAAARPSALVAAALAATPAPGGDLALKGRRRPADN